ncbi:hypothetical protein E4U36_002641 [Claviceps purpurea]|nr:hypothetical protein E4U36_002641 [Claviceps purpurea]
MERQGAQKSSNPLKKLPRHKRHRIASQVKTGKTFSTDEVHPNLELSRKYGTANWRHDEGKPIAKPNTATVAELQDQILFYLNEYSVGKIALKVFQSSSKRIIADLVSGMALADGKGYEKGVCWAILQIW